MSTTDTDVAPALSRRTVTQYAIGSIGTGGFNTLPGLVLLYYLTDVVGIAALAAGVVVAVAKVWDVVIDPVMARSATGRPHCTARGAR